MCAVLTLLAIFAAAAQGQPAVCDPDVMRLANPRNPSRYEPRGTRCEGVYDPERSGDAALALVSFTSMYGTFDPQRDRTVLVRWAAPAGTSPVHLRGYSLKPRTYYQMDATLEPAKAPFAWPLQLLQDVGLQRRDLALLAWTTYKTGSVSREVYVPVSIAADPATGPPAVAPRLVLRPGRSLNEIFLTVQSLDANLAPSSPLLKDEAYGEGPYPAEVPIVLDWKRLKIAAPGFYSVKIGAAVANGTPATLPLTLYYANP